MESVASEIGLRLDRSSPVPLYHQLSRELERAIAVGDLAKGGFLENEVELAELWKVSRPTVRRAIRELVEGGLVVRRRGVGTQIVNNRPRPHVKLHTLYDELLADGRSPSTSVIINDRIIADYAVTEALGLAPGSLVVHLERCRYAESKRIAILSNWLKPDVADDITTEDLTSQGLYALLRAKGVRPHYAIQTIGARSALPTDAALLDLPVGAPLLTMRRVVQDSLGVAVEVGDHVYSAREYSFDMTVVET